MNRPQHDETAALLDSWDALHPDDDEAPGCHTNHHRKRDDDGREMIDQPAGAEWLFKQRRYGDG